MKKLNLVIDNTNWLEATWTEEITTEVQVEKEGEIVTEEKTEIKVLHCESYSGHPEHISMLRARALEFETPLDEYEDLIQKAESEFEMPSQEEARNSEYQTKLSAINNEYNNAIANLSRGVPDTERSTWTKQEQEAKEVIAGNTNVPMLSALAKAREIPLEYLASKVIEKANLYAMIVGELTGKRQRDEDLLKEEYKDIL